MTLLKSRRWSPEEDALLRAIWGEGPASSLAWAVLRDVTRRISGRTWGSVANRAHVLCLPGVQGSTVPIPLGAPWSAVDLTTLACTPPCAAHPRRWCWCRKEAAGQRLGRSALAVHEQVTHHN